MRVLLDESLPRDLARELPNHAVRTVQQQGWTGYKNGALVRAAAELKFTILVTADRGIEHQQNLEVLRSLGIGIIVLRAKSTRIADLRPLIPALDAAISAVVPGEVQHVGV